MAPDCITGNSCFDHIFSNFLSDLFVNKLISWFTDNKQKGRVSTAGIGFHNSCIYLWIVVIVCSFIRNTICSETFDWDCWNLWQHLAVVDPCGLKHTLTSGRPAFAVDSGTRSSRPFFRVHSFGIHKAGTRLHQGADRKRLVRFNMFHVGRCWILVTSPNFPEECQSISDIGTYQTLHNC